MCSLPTPAVLSIVYQRHKQGATIDWLENESNAFSKRWASWVFFTLSSLLIKRKVNG